MSEELQEFLEWKKNKELKEKELRDKELEEREKHLQEERKFQPLPNINNTTINKRGNNKVLIIALIFIAIGGIGVGAYNYYLINQMPLINSEWRCMTERCISYYTQQEFFNNFCDEEFCTFTFQNREQTFTRASIEDLPSEHIAFCKSFTCDFEILGRIAK